MAWLYGTIAVAVVFAIAAALVGREARRLDAEPPRATFDIDEATEWVANHLPYEISAVLSYEDVRAVLEWTLDYLRVKGMPAADRRQAPEIEVVVDQEELANHLVDAARRAGRDITPSDIDALLDAEFRYFEEIGAIGPQAAPGEA